MKTSFNYNEKCLVVIGAGEFQLPLINRAIELGIYLIGFDGNKNAIGLKKCSESYVIDIFDYNSIINLLKSLNKKIDGVTSLAAESAVITVSQIAKEFNLNGPSLESSQICTNKYLMRECFKLNQIPSPDFELVNNSENLNFSISRFKYPLVLKPIDNAGSRGVIIVENESNLEFSTKHAFSHSKSGSILIEEFMDGQEISVEAFIQNNEINILSLSDKVRTPLPYPLDTHVIFPSNKPKDIQNKAIEIAKSAITATGLNNSLIHMELMVISNNVKIVEMAARGAGFHVYSKILSWVCGVNTIDILINISLGNQISSPERLQRGAVLSFPYLNKGLVEEISNIEEIKKIEFVDEIEIYVKRGDYVNELKSGSDRIGHIITLANTREIAFNANKTAENLINIKIKNESER